ncbi:MAG: calcium/sodium antiporter [Paludibacteraceae bacterium]|nr:calcium/sodium antiporter [Paludibacteraceae bacterium]
MNNLVESIFSNPWLLTLTLIVGLVLLVKGADWLVDGASAVAKQFGISDLVIGLTVVAFGTSMPEFVVNMVSVANEATDLALTNILGSNIINTFVILGLTALVYPIASQKRSRDFDIPMSIIAGFMVFMCVAVRSPFGEEGYGVTRLGGVMLLLLFVYFLFNTIRHAKDHPDEADAEEVKQIPTFKAVLLIIVGLIGLIAGGEMIVKSAVQIATNMGVSQAIIGLTIVALGTSLPELATSVIAATKHNSDIALGNVIGSNIFNVYFVLAASAVIHPLPAYNGIVLDAWIAVLGSMLVWLFVKTNRARKLPRWGGAILLAVYAAYLIYRLVMIQ